MRTAIFVLISACLALGGCGGPDETAVRNGVAQTSNFVVREHAGGEQSRSTQIADGTLEFVELQQYLMDGTTLEGSRSMTTFTPGLVVSSETLEINFLESGVVISTRSSAAEAWSQRTRRKTSSDERIEALLLSNLELVGAAPGTERARVDPWGDIWIPVRGEIGMKGEWLVFAGRGGFEGQYYLDINLNSANLYGEWLADLPALAQRLREDARPVLCYSGSDAFLTEMGRRASSDPSDSGADSFEYGGMTAADIAQLRTELHPE